MAAYTVENITLTGNIDPTFVAVASSDTFANDGSKTFLYIKNGSGGTVVATFDDTGSNAPTGAKSFNPDVDITMTAGQEVVVGPFPLSRFGSTVTVNYDVTTSVTAAAFKLA